MNIWWILPSSVPRFTYDLVVGVLVIGPDLGVLIVPPAQRRVGNAGRWKVQDSRILGRQTLRNFHILKSFLVSNVLKRIGYTKTHILILN